MLLQLPKMVTKQQAKAIEAFIDSSEAWMLKQGFDIKEDMEIWYNSIDGRLYFRQETLIKSIPYEPKDVTTGNGEVR